ncbi:MAG: hypothetical protein HS115_19605 [Spirochaetales bacterium]|nr:hypothetical protein [Spirochaetales bacterium]
MAYLELFSALRSGSLESQQPGHLLVISNAGPGGYAVFSITSFDHVREIFPEEGGVGLHADGYKIYMIHEPVSYPKKYEEPYLRADEEQIPLRLSELAIVEVDKQCRFLISAHPFFSSGSLDRIRERAATVALYFPEKVKGFNQLLDFLRKELHTTYNVPSRAVEQIIRLLESNFQEIQSPA